MFTQMRLSKMLIPKNLSNGKQKEMTTPRNDDEKAENHDKSRKVLRSYKMTLRKRLPFIVWVPQYSWSYLLRDFIAGITVGLTAIPQGIAYAVVAGVEPQYGLYASIMQCFVYILFGSCKDMTMGPTAIMSLMTYPYATAYGPAFAILLTFLSGITSLLLAVFQLGFLVDFISLPVTTGFTAAASFTIASSQLRSFLGIPEKSNGVVNNWLSAFRNLNKINTFDTTLGIITILALLAGRYIKNKSSKYNGERLRQQIISRSMWLFGLSGNALVVIFGSALAYFLTVNGKSPFALTGHVTGGLPQLALPQFSTANSTFSEMVKDMGSSVVAIPLVAIMETITIAKAFEKGKGVDATQEIIALGLSNIFGSFVGSIPISGSFTRSAINNTSGVKTPLGGLFTGLLVLMALSFLTSLFYYIPKATLAGLIITAMAFMVEYDTILITWKSKKSDLIPLCASFFACLFFGVELGMVIGITTNIFVLLYQVARPSIHCRWTIVKNRNLLIIQPKQSLLFPAMPHVRECIIEKCNVKNDYGPVIIDGSYIFDIDSTTAKIMKSLFEDLKSRGQPLYLWRWNDRSTRAIINYDSCLVKCFRNETTLEDMLTESPLVEEATKVYSNNYSNEELTNVQCS